MAIIQESSPVVKGKYICPRTHQKFDYQTIMKTWRCLCCNKPLNILAKFRNGSRSVVKRISASEVKVGNLFLLPGEEDCNEILNVKIKDNIVYMAIKGFGHQHWNADAFVNIVDGSWSE